MRLFVDGIIFSLQKKGGISRVFSEILPLMCALNRSLEVTLLVQGYDRGVLPKGKQIVLAPDREWPVPKGILGKLFLKVQRYLCIANVSLNVPMVWYSSYYTLPPKWKGPIVMLVADLIHELYPDLFMGPKNEKFRRRKSRCIAKADTVICISESTRKDLINFYKIDPLKTQVALLACSEIFRPLKEANQGRPRTVDKPFLLYIGTRVHYKNYDFFIRVYAQWARDKDIDVVLVGPPLNKEEKETVDMLGISNRVCVLNVVDDGQLCGLYNQAVAFVYPSIYEGFGIPLLEAMACGCPVIASDIPSSREIAGDVPFYFSLENENSLRTCFEAVMDNTLTASVKEKGILHARRYKWEKTAGETLNILTQSMKDWKISQ